MKTLVNVKRWWLLISVMALLPFVGYAHVSQTDSTTEEAKKKIELDTSGWIEKPARSLSVTDCQSGNAIYTMEVPQGNGSLIVIPTDGWGSGRYCLTISNLEMGYVFGYFNL